MPKLKIDNHDVEVPPGATILDAARKLGINIPTLCHREGCTPNTSCLTCVVKVNGSARMVPSCGTKAVDGMVVESETAEVHDARRMALELLLSDHAGDCRGPCQNVCPAHMDIPLMIRQIQSGQLREALITVKEMIALPAALGRVCPELCEKGCRRGAMDSPVSICRLKRHVADVDLASGHPYLPACRPATGKRIAIVGAGPTGLAAAWYLLQLGHAAVLFDNHEQAGGNLRYAVGTDKLPHDVLEAEINVIKALGAEFRCGLAIGKEIALPELRREFDAVLLAVGEIDKPKAAALGLEMLGKGLKVQKETMMTALEGVFAAGAAVSPFRHAVRAVAEGREAANILDLYVRGLKIVPEGPAFTVRLGVLNPVELAAFTAGADPQGRIAPPEQTGFSVPDARAEAYRCLHCDCGKLHNCDLRIQSMAYNASITRYRMERKSYERIVSHADVVYEPGKCIACGLCVQITQRAKEPLGLTFIGRGFRVRIAAPFDQAMSEALKQVAQEVVAACPTGALVMRADLESASRPMSEPAEKP